MGIKRRIMTSGRKFYKKHRAFLEKAGLTDADPKAIDIPGMTPFIGNLEVTPHGNQLFAFKCFVEGDIEDNDVLQVKLNGTAIKELAIPNAAAANSVSVEGLIPEKVILVMPAEVDAYKAGANPAITDVDNAVAKSEDHIALLANGSLAIANPGKNSLELVVKRGGAALSVRKFGKKINFISPEAKVDLSKIEPDGFEGTGAGAKGKLKVAGAADNKLNVVTAAGSCPGEAGFTFSGANGTNKIKVEFFLDGDAVADPGGDFAAAAGPCFGAIHGKKTGGLGGDAVGKTLTVKLTATPGQNTGALTTTANTASERTITIGVVPAA